MRKNNVPFFNDKYCLEVFKVGTFCSSLGPGLKEMIFIFQKISYYSQQLYKNGGGRRVCISYFYFCIVYFVLSFHLK